VRQRKFGPLVIDNNEVIVVHFNPKHIRLPHNCP
jgi:hypothetical protein